jgi:nicotinamidase-related amidase
MVNKIMVKNCKNLLCDVNTSCLMIVDIQEKLSAVMPEKVINRLKINTNILLTAANQLNVPVIATMQYPKGLGGIESFVKDKLNETSKCFEKTSFSGLEAEGLLEHLDKLNKKQIILIGLESHICVLQTALEFIEKGYDVFVVSDAIASRKLTSYETALTRLEQSDVWLLNTESVLFEWLRDAAHAEFKSLSKLIL